MSTQGGLSNCSSNISRVHDQIHHVRRKDVRSVDRSANDHIWNHLVVVSCSRHCAVFPSLSFLVLLIVLQEVYDCSCGSGIYVLELFCFAFIRQRLECRSTAQQNRQCEKHETKADIDVLESGSATSGAPSTSSGSFFGNTSKPTTSLFGNTNTTQQQSGSSLFGSTTNTQQQSGTSLFGNTTNTAQQQGGSSLFGGLGAKTTSTTAPATSSMFGTTTTATSGVGYSVCHFWAPDFLMNKLTNNSAQGGTTGSTLFGSTATSQGQSKPAFPSLGGTTSGPSFLYVL